MVAIAQLLLQLYAAVTLTNAVHPAFEANPALVSPGGSQCCILISTSSCCPHMYGDRPTCIGSGGIAPYPLGPTAPGGVQFPSIFQPTAPQPQPRPGGVFPGPIQTPPVGGGQVNIMWPGGVQLPITEQNQRCQDILREICKYCQAAGIQPIPQPYWPRPWPTATQQTFAPFNPSAGQMQVPSPFAPNQDQTQMTSLDINLPIWSPTSGQQPLPPTGVDSPWAVTWEGNPIDWSKVQIPPLSPNPETNMPPNFNQQIQTDENPSVVNYPDFETLDPNGRRSQRALTIARAVAKRWEYIMNTKNKAYSRNRQASNTQNLKIDATPAGLRFLKELNNSALPFIARVQVRPTQNENSADASKKST
ncbi:hypothetical protein T12_9761 [Trichinella patagoniensis]|uniref:Uncharacterized protein n=1 Tax=Trichinella patagoniensis TaxID=990121 RepID=A0A0V1A343_9BILA|nr:hypothetical protein T12_9761 [Trichinella patagoniensis]